VGLRTPRVFTSVVVELRVPTIGTSQRDRWCLPAHARVHFQSKWFSTQRVIHVKVSTIMHTILKL